MCDLLDTLPDTEASQALRRLPRLFGGAEILDEAAQLCTSHKAQEALEYLRKIYADAVRLGAEGSITIDLGLVHRNNYYTGLVFRGYIPGSGATVLSGGRYDHLLGEFGNPLPATGFGVEVDELYKALLDSDAAPAVHVPDALVFGVEGCELASLQSLRNWRARGSSVRTLPVLHGRMRCSTPGAIGSQSFTRSPPPDGRRRRFPRRCSHAKAENRLDQGAFGKKTVALSLQWDSTAQSLSTRDVG